jgi:hypothetical protein
MKLRVIYLHHFCVLSYTHQSICPSINKTNDNNVDCLGATDESTLCRVLIERKYCHDFYCANDNSQSLTSLGLLRICSGCQEVSMQSCEDLLGKYQIIYFSLNIMNKLVKNRAQNMKNTMCSSLSII